VDFRRRLTLVALALMTMLPAGTSIAGATVPFKGFDAGTFGLPQLCSNGSLNVVIGGAGSATHLGQYAYSASECFDPSTGAFSGSATFTAANGDRAWGSYRGTVGTTSDPDVIAYRELLHVTGGSGRFANVDGELEIIGLANLTTGEYSQTIRGWITNLGLTSGD
jgi:hypothetical protein